MKQMDQRRSLIHIISANRWGGAQTYALDICNHYKQQGWNVLCLTRGARIIDARFDSLGIETRHAPLRGFFDLASAKMLADIFRKLPPGPCIVHVHHYRDALTAILAEKLSKREVRIIATRHAIRKGKNSILFRQIYKKVNAHIFVSKLAFDRFCNSWVNKCLPLPSDRVFILHNSLNIPNPQPLPEPERGAITAMYHGPIVSGKGIENIIDALPAIKDLKLRLMIAGTGSPDFLDIIRRRAMALGVMDMIDWNTGCEDPSTLIGKCHFGVVPSIEREAFGMANIRYMAFGRPQICTNNGAPAEYLRNGESAIIVEPGNTEALAQAMRSLASNQELRLKLGLNAFREFSNRLSWNLFIKKLNDIYLPPQNQC